MLISSDEIYSIGCCSGVSLSDSFVARVFLSTKFHSSVGASTNNIRFGVFVKVVLIWVNVLFFHFVLETWMKVWDDEIILLGSIPSLTQEIMFRTFKVYGYPFIWDAGLLLVSISSSSRYTFKLFLSPTFVIYDHTHSSLACWRIVLSIQKFILLNNDVFDLYPQVY